MDRPTPRPRTIGLIATGFAAVALFAQSLAGLAGIDGRLAKAVSDERDPVVVPVATHDDPWARNADCPAHERRNQGARVRL